MSPVSDTQVPMKYPDRIYVGGEWVATSAGASFDVIDSNTEKLYFTIAEAREPDMERAIQAARHAFDDFFPQPHGNGRRFAGRAEDEQAVNAPADDPFDQSLQRRVIELIAAGERGGKGRNDPA